jgi:dTDP-4-amino-4,6-dideoxygalactose transaminase
MGHKPGDFTESERAEREVLSLPIYPEMEEGQVGTVAGIISDFLRKK